MPRARLSADAGDTVDLQDKPESDTDDQATVRNLQNEIYVLEQRLQQFRNAGKGPKETGSPLPSLQSINEEIHQLEQLVKENEILSGLTIAETSECVLQQDMTSSLRQHSVQGEAGGIQFKLQYEVCEQFAQGEAGQAGAEVLTLEMDVRDDMVALLKPHLYSVANDRSVRELFQLMSSYGRWVEDRERAINHFASTFPELVQRVDANDKACTVSMVLTDPKQDVKFRIEWGMKVLPMRSLVPHLQLHVDASSEVMARDKKGVLESAPEVFQIMLRKFGIESALQMLVKLLDE